MTDGWVEYEDQGQVLARVHYVNGKIHREDGPAVYLYINGQVDKDGYALHDKFMNEEDWLIQVKLLKSKNGSLV